MKNEATQQQIGGRLTEAGIFTTDTTLEIPET